MKKRKLLFTIAALLCSVGAWAETTFSETYTLTGRSESDWSNMLKTRDLAGKTFEVFVNGTNEHVLVWGGSTTSAGLDVGGRAWGVTAFAFRNVSQGDKVAITVANKSTLSALSLYANSDKISYTDNGSTRTFSIDESDVSAIEINFPQDGTGVVITQIVYTYQLPTGFTKVTSVDALTSANFANNYYVIAEETYPGLLLSFNTIRGGDGHTDLSYKLKNDIINPYSIWTLETNETGKFSMRNVVRQGLMLQTESYGAYPIRHNDQPNVCEWTQIVPATDSQGGFTFQWEKYANGSNYWGLWTPANDYFDGEYLAGNKTATAEIGHYYIYAIPRGTLDFTSFITNAAVANTEGWIGASGRSGEQYTGAPDNYYLDYCHWGEQGTTGTNDMYQTLSDLPAGVYTLKAATRSHSEVSEAYIYAAQGGSNIATANCNKDGNTGGALGNGWSWTEFRFVKPNADDMNIGFYSVTGREIWVGADDFHLFYHGEIPTDGEKTAFTSARTTANGYRLGFETEEYAPYSNIAAITALIAANAIDPDKASKEELTSITSAIGADKWTANVSEVNAFYDGDFSGCAEDNISPLDYTPAGWTASENMRMMLKDKGVYPGLSDASASSAMMSWPGGITYGETTGYEMPLKGNSIYLLKFKAAGWDNETRSGMTVSVLNSSDGMAAINLGTPDRDIKGNETNVAGMTSYEVLFATGAAGNYVFHIQSGNNFVITDLELKKATSQVLEFADGSVPSYAPGTYPSVKITRTLTAGRWATAIYPFSVSKGATGINDIAVLENYNASTGVLSFTSTDTNTANRPFLMRSTAGTSEITLSNVAVFAANATDATAGKASLKGTYTRTDITNEQENYVLSNNTIYSVGTAGATINPYRAYIQIDPSAGVKALSFVIDDDDATSINEVLRAEDEESAGTVYDLSGRKMVNAQCSMLNGLKKGIYIVNGKKVMVK